MVTSKTPAKTNFQREMGKIDPVGHRSHIDSRTSFDVISGLRQARHAVTPAIGGDQPSCTDRIRGWTCRRVPRNGLMRPDSRRTCRALTKIAPTAKDLSATNVCRRGYRQGRSGGGTTARGRPSVAKSPSQKGFEPWRLRRGVAALAVLEIRPGCSSGVAMATALQAAPARVTSGFRPQR